MPRATKKNLGRKKPSKTRKNRKPLKKNKRKNIKKGGGFLNMNTLFTTFDYSQRIDEVDIKYFVDEAYKLNSKPQNIFNDVGIHTAFANKIQTDFPFKDNKEAYREQFNSIMKTIDDNKKANGNVKKYFNDTMPTDPQRIGCIITRATGKSIKPQGRFSNKERDLIWCKENKK